MRCVFSKLGLAPSALTKRVPSFSWETRHEIDVFSCMVSVEFRLTGVTRANTWIGVFFLNRSVVISQNFRLAPSALAKPLPVHWRKARLKTNVFACVLLVDFWLAVLVRICSMFYLRVHTSTLCFLITSAHAFGAHEISVRLLRKKRRKKRCFLVRGFGEFRGTRENMWNGEFVWWKYAVMSQNFRLAPSGVTAATLKK